MTSSELIGRETMIGRLQAFHAARIQRVFGHSLELLQEKLDGYSYASYKAKSTKKICREYDETFSELIERNGKMFWPWELR